jgi:hypothetical protein
MAAPAAGLIPIENDPKATSVSRDPMQRRWFTPVASDAQGRHQPKSDNSALLAF